MNIWALVAALALLIPLLALLLDSRVGRALAHRLEGDPGGEETERRLDDGE